MTVQPETDILFLNPIAAIGGAERVLLQILQSEAKRRDPGRIALLTPESGELTEAAKRLGLRCYQVPWTNRLKQLSDFQSHTGPGKLFSLMQSSPGFLITLYRWKKLLDQLKPKLIYSNGLKTHFISALLRPQQSRLIWHLHDVYSLKTVGKHLLKTLSPRVTKAVAISNYVAEDARQIMPRTSIEVIHNGIDTTHFHNDLAQSVCLDQLAGFAESSDCLRVGLMATYANWKGQDVFLDAISMLKLDASLPHTRYYIIGGPIYSTAAQWTTAELAHMIHSRNLSQDVGLVAYQTDPVKVYQSLDLFVHASKVPEPFGLTIAEAMACGKPVIYTNAGGAAEIAVHGVSGYGIAINSPLDLAEAIGILLNQPQLRVKMADAARERIVESFAQDRFERQIAQLIDAAVDMLVD